MMVMVGIFDPNNNKCTMPSMFRYLFSYLSVDFNFILILLLRMASFGSVCVWCVWCGRMFNLHFPHEPNCVTHNRLSSSVRTFRSDIHFRKLLFPQNDFMDDPTRSIETVFTFRYIVSLCAWLDLSSSSSSSFAVLYIVYAPRVARLYLVVVAAVWWSPTSIYRRNGLWLCKGFLQTFATTEKTGEKNSNETNIGENNEWTMSVGLNPFSVASTATTSATVTIFIRPFSISNPDSFMW